VVSNILRFAVDNGVLASNAMGQVGIVKSQRPRQDRRDHRRAMTSEERESVLAFADKLAADKVVNPRTRRKRHAVADLLAFLAGTGARINEARTLRWEHVDLDRPLVELHGTKSRFIAAERHAPGLARGPTTRAPSTTEQWGLSSPPRTTRTRPIFSGTRATFRRRCASCLISGVEWAVPHTLRRTVATRLHAANVPLIDIADQLGHANPTMTAEVYLGRDFLGDRPHVAEHL
jgi:integrase